jgi:hypothetical protein
MLSGAVREQLPPRRAGELLLTSAGRLNAGDDEFEQCEGGVEAWD